MSTQDHPKPGVRNRYYRHKAMKAEDFRQEQHYLIERRRLINRTVIGWGVVRGLTAKLENGHITVTQGFGLDRAGREIVVIDGVQLTTRNTFVKIKNCTDKCFERISEGTFNSGETYRLRIHFAERSTGDAYLPDSGCGKPEYRYTEETVVFSLSAESEDIEDSCAANEQKAEKCKMNSSSGECDACEKEKLHLQEQIFDWTEVGTGVVRMPSLDKKQPADLKSIDWCDGLEIAELTGTGTTGCDCHYITSSKIRDLISRQTVKSNDLLYDLVRKRSLTTITSISWPGQHFTKTCTIDECISIFTVGPTINFSRNVKTNHHCISVRFDVTWKNDDIANNYTYSPIVKDNTTESCSKHTFKFDTCWDELKQQIIRRFNRHEEGNYPELKITIEIFGDLILDDYGQAVDASNRGIAPPSKKCPTGNGTPGGTFRSVILFTNKQDEGATS